MRQREALQKNHSHRGPRNAADKKGRLTASDQRFINRIIKEFKSRSRVDIDAWRNCIKEAENDRYPKRVKWGVACKDLDIDAHWSSQVLLRKLAVLCKQFRIVTKGTSEENVEKTKLFKAPWFYKYLSIVMDAKLYGTQLVEIVELIFGIYTKDAIWQVPIENFIPDKKEFLLRTSSNSGIYYGEDPYVIQIDEDSLMGLLNKAAPHIIWKKNAQQSWAEFCEKFGIPLRYATTNKKDKQTIDRIEMMLDRLGSAAKAIFPEGTTLDFKEADTSDAFNVFDKMIERCNSEMSKLINGVTMLSDNGSSLSQSKVHFDVNKHIVMADSQDTASDINFNLFPRLNLIGFDIDPEKEEFQWDETETLSKKDQWNVISGILKYFEIDEKWIGDQFAVPITGKRATQPTGDDPLNQNSDVTAMLDRIKNGEQLSSEELTSFIVEVLNPSFNKGHARPALHGPKFTIAGYDSLLNCCDHQHSTTSALNEVDMSTFNGLFLKAAEKFFNNKNNKPSALRDDEWKALYEFTADKFWKGAKKGYGEVRTDFETEDKEMLTKLRENMYMFSAAKDFQLLQTLNANLRDENGKLREWGDFKSLALQANNKYNVNWLQAEYDTAIASAQSAARWQELWNERDEYDLLYSLIEDDNNSEICLGLKGVVCSPDDAIVSSITPPNHWRCRSEWEQIRKGSRTKTTNVSTAEIPKMFRNNVGKTGQVFTKDHPYWSDISTADRKSLNKLATDTLKETDKSND